MPRGRPRSGRSASCRRAGPVASRGHRAARAHPRRKTGGCTACALHAPRGRHPDEQNAPARRRRGASHGGGWRRCRRVTASSAAVISGKVKNPRYISSTTVSRRISNQVPLHPSESPPGETRSARPARRCHSAARHSRRPSPGPGARRPRAPARDWRGRSATAGRARGR